MFEQELYAQETRELPTQPGDLFYNYEIKNWNFSPRLYKILGFSAIFNILALVVIGSSEMLTTRGCDSPFVGRVCQVLDTVYVGTIIAATGADYVDAPYEKTDLEDADVTFIDLSGVEPPLTYPAGYFQLANPEQQFANMTDPTLGASNGFIAPGIPSNPTIPGSGLLNTPAIKPPSNPNAVPNDLPTGSPLGDPNSSPNTNPTFPGRKGRRGGRVTDPGVNDGVAKTDPEPTPSIDPNQPLEDKPLNRRPFVDLATAVNGMLSNQQLNLDTEFSVTAKGKLTSEGKLDKKTFRFTSASSSDPKMVDVVKQSIEAFNDSGMLAYLEKLSGKDLNLAISQDKENISGEVRSAVESETRARSFESAFKLILSYQKEKKANKIAQLQAENKPENAEALQAAIDELDLLNKTEIVAEGNQFVVRFKSPKAAMHGLIQRKLDAQAKEVKKESGIAPVVSNDNTAKK
jgi:hypothetical protein